MADTTIGSVGIDVALTNLGETLSKMCDMLIVDSKAGGIKEVIFNDPVTVVNWIDGEKTVVRCQPGDLYDKRTGLLLCIAKRFYGNGGKFNDVLNKYCPDEQPDAMGRISSKEAAKRCALLGRHTGFSGLCFARHKGCR